jgi:chemotaxis protein MotB
MRAKGDKKGGNRGAGIIIRKEEVIEGGHHGGAWKVAYADFVTAMMAFFLLMWLLNATTEEQRKGLADYFSPSNVLSRASSGTGQPFGGHTPFDQGTMVSDRGAVQVIQGTLPIAPDEDDEDDRGSHAGTTATRDSPSASKQAAAGSAPPAATIASPDAAPDDRSRLSQQQNPAASAPRAPSDAEIRAAQEKRERQAFEQAAQQIKEAVRADPALADLARQLAIDMTPEGLRIQILDEDRQPMFATGSAALNERARLLLQKVAPVLMKLPEDISIAGHTDATPYHSQDRSNWELSTERANATRRLMVEAGLPETRIRNVTGNADRDPLLPAEPTAAANRRIAIVVLRAARGTQSEDPPRAKPPVAPRPASP